MEVVNTRPKLITFRVTSFHGDNKAASSGTDPWNIELTQTIEVGLEVPTTKTLPLYAVVKIDFVAQATKENAKDQTAKFSAEYMARFEYPSGVTESDIAPMMQQESYQYVLVAQGFPLAMTHFRRELQALGFDARNLPLGI